MKEKLYITIPEPCHEDWNKMNPVEQGKFCGSCQKNVVDFSSSSDDEIFNFFKNYDGTTCGRFDNEQLERPIEVFELKPASSFLKYAASLLLPALMMGTKTNAQQKETRGKVVIAGGVSKRLTKDDLIQKPFVNKGDTFKIKQIKSLPVEQLLRGTIGGVMVIKQNSKIKFKGRVVDAEDGSPIIGVSILIKGFSKGTVSNENGEFELLIESWNTTLEFTSVGFLKTELNLNTVSIKNEYTVKLSAAVMGMGEVLVVGNNFNRVKGRLGGAIGRVTFQKLSIWDRIKDTILPEKIKIYPNPVSLSGTINLSFTNLKIGQYQIRLLNSVGQLFYSFQKQISINNEIEQIHLNEKMSAGIYIVQVIDEKKKLVQSSKVIVQ